MHCIRLMADTCVLSVLGSTPVQMGQPFAAAFLFVRVFYWIFAPARPRLMPGAGFYFMQNSKRWGLGGYWLMDSPRLSISWA